MKKTFRRFLGIMLVFVLAFSIIPTSALEPNEEGGGNEETVVEDAVQEQPDTIIEEKQGGEEHQGEEIPAKDPLQEGSGECPHNTWSEGQENGYIVKTCLDCGTVLSRKLDHAHTYGEPFITVEPSCANAGEKKYYCKKCDYSYTESIPALEHNYEFWCQFEPACDKEGFDFYVCSECNAEDNRNVVPATGHDYREKTVDLPGGGTYVITKCNNCGHVLRDEVTGDVHTHTYTSEITVEPTCTEPGVITYTCIADDCDGKNNATYTEEISARGHNYIWKDDSVLSCTNDGVMHQECIVCEEIGETKTTPATGHTWNTNALMKVVIEPDCYHEGMAVVRCIYNDGQKEITIPPTDHEFYESDRVPSTCTTKGYIEYSCDNCDDKRREDLPLGEHDYVNQTVFIPSCTSAGYKADVCRVCGDEKNNEAIPATGHSMELVQKTNATCTEASKEKYVCSTCGAVKFRHEDAATGHDFDDDWTVTITPTCTTTGTESRTCKNGCGETETREVDKIPHSYEWVRTTDPTIFATGEDSYKCSVCDHVSDTREVPKLDHTHEFDSETVVTEPTCQSTGIGKHTCKACKEEITYEIPKVEHRYGELEVDVPSTCVTRGQSSKKCVWCGLKDGSSVVSLPLAAHTYSDTYTIDTMPTCSAEGSKSKHCTVEGCDAKIDVQSIEKTEHRFIESGRTEATCTENGVINYACADCDATMTDTETLTSLGHSYQSTITRPTCTEDGYTTYICTRCDNSYIDDRVPATGHTPGEPNTENAVRATCSSEGSYDDVTYCETCHAVLNTEHKTVEKTAHTPGGVVYENEVAPSCVEAGSKEAVTYCTVCDTEVSRESVEVPALGHDYKGTLTAPTCTTDGFTTYICSRCRDEKVDDRVPATGHTPKEAVPENENAATCTEDGSHEDVIYCETCNAEISRTPVVDEALGHDYLETVVAPTCNKKGYTLHKCSRCTAEYKDTETEKIAHTPGVWKTSKAPTCTEAGLSSQYCSACEEVIDTIKIPIDADAHKFVANTVNEKDPTCTEKGKRIDKCEYCNITKEVELAALGHNYKSKVTKEPTENSKGVRTYTCTRCNNSYTRSIPKLEKKEETKTDSSSTTTPTPAPTPTITVPAPNNTPAPIVDNNSNGQTTTRPDYSAKADEDAAKDAVEKLEKVKNESVVIENTDAKVTSDMLKAASNNNNEIVLKQDNYIWYIEGDSIKEAKDVDLGVKLGSSNIAITELKNFVKNSKFIELSLNYDGSFGFDATLEINVDKEYNGKAATLFYYNNGKFEEKSKTTVKDNSAKFKFKHASEYVIVFDDETETVANNEMTDNKVANAKTTNTVNGPTQNTNNNKPFNPVIPIIFVVILAGIIVAFILFKKKSR